jgi:hypothetical protein
MATDLFSSLLEELGPLLGADSLKPDQNNSCLIKLPNGVSIQIEPDKRGESIIIGSDLGEAPPPGKYRKDLLKAALISNGLPPPREGIFAYSKQSSHLIIYKMLSTTNLTGRKIAEVVTPLSEKALLWKEAIARGEIPFLSITGSPPSFGGLFGLIR